MRRNVTILLGFLVLLAVIVLWKRPRNAEPAPDASAPTAEPPPTSTNSALPPALATREKRDELRRKILEAWAKGEQGEQAAKDAKRGRFEEHPNKDGEGIDPAFIQAAVREQFYPMIKACYEELLSRDPKSTGTVDLWFKIVADDELGGIAEEDDEHDGGMVSGSFTDEKFQTCTRESMLTVTFPPPAHGGVVTVGYPIVFSQNDNEEDAQ